MSRPSPQARAVLRLTNVLLDATDDLPDDIDRGVAALLACRDDVLAALGAERQREYADGSLWFVPR